MNPFDRQAPIPGIKHIIAVGSGKGGVGKSTVAANLALALLKRSTKVGLLDADIYGPSIPRLFGVAGQKPDIGSNHKIMPLKKWGLKLMSMGFMLDENKAVIWRGPMLFKAIGQFFFDVDWEELDYLVIDLPPGTGDVALTIAQKVPVSAGITVCTPQNLALLDAKKAIDMFEKVNIPHWGVIENMSYLLAPGTGEKIQLFPKGELNQFLDAKKIAKLAEIPFNPSVGICSEAGMPIVESDPQAAESQIFFKLADQLIQKFN